MRKSRHHGPSELSAEEVAQHSFDFAVAVVRLARACSDSLPQSVSQGLVGRGTSIGADMANAQASKSRRGALSKMTSARHTSHEMDYWLRLVAAADLAPEDAVQALMDEAKVLHASLTALCAKARKQLEADQRT